MNGRPIRLKEMKVNLWMYFSGKSIFRMDRTTEKKSLYLGMLTESCVTIWLMEGIVEL